MKSLFVVMFTCLAISASAIKPEREYKFTPDMHGLKYSEYQVKTPDGFNINVWEYEVPDSVKSLQTGHTIVMAGSDAGNMGYFIWQARALSLKGIRVISFDYRGFGKSSDFAMNNDFLFYNEFGIDLDSVIRATRAKYPKGKVGVLGLSMGSYIGLVRKEKIDFYVAEGFYYDPAAVAEKILTAKNKKVILPAKSVSVTKLDVPALIFCASKDQVTIPQFGKDYAEKNKAAVVDFEGEHLWGLSVFSKAEPGDEYAAKIREFLKQL